MSTRHANDFKELSIRIEAISEPEVRQAAVLTVARGRAEQVDFA
jgi:hypothetical protein